MTEPVTPVGEALDSACGCLVSVFLVGALFLCLGACMSLNDLFDSYLVASGYVGETQ